MDTRYTVGLYVNISQVNIFYIHSAPGHFRGHGSNKQILHFALTPSNKRENNIVITIPNIYSMKTAIITIILLFLLTDPKHSMDLLLNSLKVKQCDTVVQKLIYLTKETGIFFL